VSVRRRKIQARMERTAKREKMYQDFDANMRHAIKSAVEVVIDRPGAPHPIDNEWRVFGNYYKCCYDVADLLTGEMIDEGCWPNAGVIRAGGRRFEAGECMVRISPMHPCGGVQINADLIERLERNYGKWEPYSPDQGRDEHG